MMHRIKKTSSFMLAAASALSLAACATDGAPPTPLAVAVVPPQAPPPPPIALSSRVVQQAAHFRTYLRKAATVSAAFKNGAEVEQSLALASGYESKQMAEGVVAYAAIIALQDPQFVASVRTFAVDPRSRRSIAEHLLADASYVAALPNADGAAGLVVATLNDEGVRVRTVGERVKQAAYDVQHQKWSKDPVPNPAVRLAQAKTISATPMSSEPGDIEELGRAIPGAESRVSTVSAVPGGPIAGPFTPLVARGLALAALAALGEAGEDNAANVQAMLTEQTSGSCLNMSKLNLYQCLAVAKPYYEDVFCLGQHVLIDTGQCIAKGAGPVAAPLASRPVSLAVGAQMAAPVGGAASIGLKQ